MIHTLSENIMVPIAGVILAIVMTVELIQMIVDRNNLHDVGHLDDFQVGIQKCSRHPHRHQYLEHRYAVFDMAQSVVAQPLVLSVPMRPLTFPKFWRIWNPG